MSTKGAVDCVVDAQNAFNQFDLSGVLSSLKELETHLACQICHKIPEENTTSTPGSHLNHITGAPILPTQRRLTRQFGQCQQNLAGLCGRLVKLTQS